MPAPLKALNYYGGKAGWGKAQWIASLLPHEWRASYVEVFGGMFGVGLARPPVKMETLNDLDERVVNWWRVVRYQPSEFGLAVQAMPVSRAEFERSIVRMDDPSLSDFERALAFHTFALQAMNTGVATKGNWRRRKRPNRGTLGRWWVERVAVLAARMWNVQLECRDGVALLHDFAAVEEAVIYCDPPYSRANTSHYRHDVDRDALSVALLAQKGRVAVSGYGDEWDGLGWRREEKEAWRSEIGGKHLTPRTEVLWMNYGKDEA